MRVCIPPDHRPAQPRGIPSGDLEDPSQDVLLSSDVLIRYVEGRSGDDAIAALAFRLVEPLVRAPDQFLRRQCLVRQRRGYSQTESHLIAPTLEGEDVALRSPSKAFG